MKTSLSTLRSPAAQLAASLLFVVAAPLRAAIDPSISEAAWSESRGVTPEQLADPGWMSEDLDGDGQTNAAELTAGTDPFQANSVIAISGIKISGGSVEITFPTVPGKSYLIQQTTNLADPQSWQPAAVGATIGDGAPKTVSVPRSAQEFYRVLVQDVDTDEDGTADYAETFFWQKYGAGSSGEPAGPPPPPAGTNIVTVQATQPFASEDGPVAGEITIRRSGTGTNALKVGYNVSGTASYPADHNRPAGTYTFPVNTGAPTDVFAVAFPVLPVVDGVVEAGESVILTVSWVLSIENGGTTSILTGSPNKGTVIINNSTAATGTGLTGKYYDTSSSTYANSANFNSAQLKVTRVDPTVDFNWVAASPDPLIGADTFSVRWTGQVQPQFSEEYTFVVNCDDSAKLWVNGQSLTLKVASTANSAGTYNYDSATGNVVVTHTNIPNGSFVVGESVRVDPTSGNLTSLAYADYVVTAVGTGTFTINVGTSFTTGTGSCNIEWLNKPIDWPAYTSADRYARVSLVGGVRYDIKLDYFEGSGSAKCQLSWYSPSQPKQIIPTNRLYPDSVAQQQANATTDATAFALVGGPFSYTIKGSNGATVSISGKPSWLSYSNGVLSGTPPVNAPGDYQILITLTNAAGTGTSVLNLRVEAPGSTIARESWTGLAGTTVADLVAYLSGTPAAPGTSNLTSLEAPTDAGEDYGARIRGYITAPTTGNYYFWIAASNAAELWISNDSEPVNLLKRAWVNTGSTTPRTWNIGVTEPNQKSPWLALEAGKKYYIEILHKAGTGMGDNLAVGWSKPGQATTAPSQVVPGFVLSPWNLVPIEPGGTVYTAILRPQAGAVTNGSGSSFLRLNQDEDEATITVSYQGLTGVKTNWHVHDNGISTNGAQNIAADLDELGNDVILQADGSYRWPIPAYVAGRSRAQIVQDLKDGIVYFNVHTAMYPAGEIKGFYSRVDGSQTFTPPAPAPSWTDDSGTPAGAARFLSQASFGGSPADIAALMAITPTGGKSRYELWIEDQFTKAPTYHLSEVQAREIADAFGPFDVRLAFNTWWKNSISGEDQLRQRVAFALNEIHVVSAVGLLEDNSRALADFYDTLLDNAFGNFRDLLEATTLAPGMGRYLDMLKNDKPDLAVGRIPNENYAREIMQLFSIGLYRMWPDGTLVLNSKYEPVDTYTQREIVGVAHVFTGWDYGYDGNFRTSLGATGATGDWTRPMREVPVRHFTGPKRVLNNEVLPGLATVGGQPLDPYATHTSTAYNDPTYQALPAKELDAVHDQLFNHPNTGPFICRQLIQRLVTSHPSRGYLYRVVQKFENHGDVPQYGSNLRGNMRAVIKAILLDHEARWNGSDTPVASTDTYGKQREPIMRVANAARAFRPGNVTGDYEQNGLLNTSGVPYITIDTSPTPHRLAAGNSVFLEFTAATSSTEPPPTTGIYTVLSNPAPTPTSYAIAATGWVTGTYSQDPGSNVMTINISSHWLPGDNAAKSQTLAPENLGQAYFDFTSGTANGLASFDQTVRTVQTSTSYDTPSQVGNVAGTTFTITAPDTTGRSGNVMISRFGGSYNCTVAGGPITIDTASGTAGNSSTYGSMADHHLLVGDQVFINFTDSRDTTSNNETSTENDLVYTIATVPDPNTFTVTSRNALNARINSANTAYVFPLKAQPLARNGTITMRQSTFKLDNTDTELAQTPLNSPTVFNYFLPDYKFPGTLASKGITTPEFEGTAETTVMRQSNFLRDGIFNPGANIDISSFRNGSNALIMDLSPWMVDANDNTGTVGAVFGPGLQPTQEWTSDANLETLVDRLNALLLGGKLPSGAKDTIVNWVKHRTISAITAGNPCTVTTSTPHGLVTGEAVTISGVSGGSPSINGSNRIITEVPGEPTKFTVPLNVTGSPSGGQVIVLDYTNSDPTPTQVRNRLRAIIHLILTSPDFTIQR
jgi:uncharacterized protein (DUF1800 family)